MQSRPTATTSTVASPSLSLSDVIIAGNAVVSFVTHALQSQPLFLTPQISTSSYHHATSLYPLLTLLNLLSLIHASVTTALTRFMVNPPHPAPHSVQISSVHSHTPSPSSAILFHPTLPQFLHPLLLVMMNNLSHPHPLPLTFPLFSPARHALSVLLPVSPV